MRTQSIAKGNQVTDQETGFVKGQHNAEGAKAPVLNTAWHNKH